MGERKAIEVNNLKKKYDNVIAVDDITFSVDEGHICAILGPNGSGKTTTIKSICNLLIPDGGSIKLQGINNKNAINKISAIFEGSRNLYWRLTPRENLRYFAGIRGLGGAIIEKRIDALLNRFNLYDKKDVQINNLSRGMQQKVAIAMALVPDTPIVLLDEPTLGLDVESFIEIRKILKSMAKEMNKTILLSTHDMNLAEEVCDDVVIIKKGKIVAEDTMENLMSVFKSNIYEFTLVNQPAEKVLSDLIKAEYDSVFDKDKRVMEVCIKDEKNIYNIMDILKENNIIVSEVKKKDKNFEDVYLNIVRGGIDNAENNVLI